MSRPWAWLGRDMSRPSHVTAVTCHGLAMSRPTHATPAVMYGILTLIVGYVNLPDHQNHSKHNKHDVIFCTATMAFVGWSLPLWIISNLLFCIVNIVVLGCVESSVTVTSELDKKVSCNFELNWFMISVELFKGFCSTATKNLFKKRVSWNFQKTSVWHDIFTNLYSVVLKSYSFSKNSNERAIKNWFRKIHSECVWNFFTMAQTKMASNVRTVILKFSRVFWVHSVFVFTSCAQNVLVTIMNIQNKDKNQG